MGGSMEVLKDQTAIDGMQNQPEGRIPVMEYFYSLQGEGAWSGSAAFFIRLAGCDVGCFWCDVKESWEVAEDQWMDIQDVVELATESGTEMVVITGGEPTMWDLNALVNGLKKAGLQVNIETAGAHPLRGNPDWICLSPKKFKQPLPEFYDLAHELKIIVYNKHDLNWAEQEASKCDPSRTKFFLQPEWGKKEEAEIWIINYVKENPKWRLSLQTHKYLDIR